MAAAAFAVGYPSAYAKRGTCRGPQLPHVPALSSSRARRRGFHPPLCISLQEGTASMELDHSKSRAEQLKKEVWKALDRSFRPRDAMKYVDALQHLGIAHHFEEKIKVLLNRFSDPKAGEEDDIFDAALRFRVMRHNGYNVPPDFFYKFLGREGKFNDCLSKDLRGLLSLHEASHLGAKDEEILSEAMKFSKEHLESLMLTMDPSLFIKVNHALKLPRHMTMERYEARRIIEERIHTNGITSPIFELASLDFNMVQSLYQGELAELIRWWQDLGLIQKLSFARDRPLECFLWSIGIFPNPCLSMCRIELAKTIAILLVIDDIYDSYGSLDDLALFTNAIKRWDLEAMDKLPEYMKICYVALYNTTNEIGYRVLKEHGYYITSHLRKTWVDISEAFLVEARWFNDGFVPTLEDYLENGITTAGTYMALVHAFFLLGNPISEESSRFIGSCPSLFSHSGRILRLWDDLGTAKDEQLRGDVASSIECYMNEKRCLSEEDARKHVKQLISNSWKDLNRESLALSPLPFSVARASLNLARTSQFVYQHGDEDKALSVDNLIQSLLFKPIKQEPMKETPRFLTNFPSKVKVL